MYVRQTREERERERGNAAVWRKARWLSEDRLCGQEVQASNSSRDKDLHSRRGKIKRQARREHVTAEVEMEEEEEEADLQGVMVGGARFVSGTSTSWDARSGAGPSATSIWA